MIIQSSHLCKKCNNQLKETFKKVHVGLGVYKNKPSGEYECPYCIWKGTTGPAAQLREIIKQENERIDAKNEINK